MIAAALTLAASVAVAVIVIIALFVAMAYALVWTLELIDYVKLRADQFRLARSERREVGR